MNIRGYLIFGSFCILEVCGQCAFSSPWASSTWLDSTHGTLTFSTTTLTGWSTTISNEVINSWDCLDNSDSTTLVMRSTQAITYLSTTIYVFLCMKLTQITTNSYSYVQQQVAQPNAGYDRLWFSTDSTLSDVSTICDTSASIPTLEFHVLVKDGMGGSVGITFPNYLLFSADYQYRASDGSVACNDTTDTMDMCTNTTALSFNNYANCKQEIAYSAGGELWCVAKASLGSYDCAVVYNRDATISGTASQFACLCSDGSSVSVVSGNCTSNQSPSSFPTAADGTTAIGYMLIIENIYVDCGPTTSSSSSSSSSNAGIIAGIVVVLILIIVVVVVSIILYNCGHCATICGCVNRCLENTPCWTTCRSKICVCCKNKVAESEKPFLENGTGPHVENIDETSTRPKTREKTAISAITRSSSVAGKREKSELEKSLIRQGTITSITAIDIKSGRSSVQHVHVKPQDGEEEKEQRLKILGFNLSFLVCCPENKDDSKTETVDKPEEKLPPPNQKKSTKNAGKKGVKGKGVKSGKKEKKSKDPQTDKTKNGAVKSVEGISPRKSQEQQTDKTKHVAVKMTEETTPRKSQDQHTDKTKNGAVELIDGTSPRKSQDQQTDKTKNGAVNLIDGTSPRKSQNQQTEKTKNGAVKSTEVENGGLNRAPTKMKSDLHLTSTPVPGGEKGQKGVVSVPAGILKPKDKPTEWTFLSCCFGNRSPPQEDGNTEEPDSTSTKTGESKVAAKSKGVGKKKAGGGAKKTTRKKGVGKGGGGKGGGNKKDANEMDLIEQDLTDDISGPERSKTMPERQKTTLSLQEAHGIKIDVYVPDDKTNLQLKDTVTVVKGTKGKPKLDKAKTDIGATRPASSRPASSLKQKSKNGKSDKKAGKKAVKGKDDGKKAVKGKDDGKKGSNDKKGGKKKKK